MAERLTPSPRQASSHPGARAIARLVRDGELSAREVIEQAFGRITTSDPAIRAFCTLSPTALDEADAIDRQRARGEPLGPLAGVPVAVKDLIPTQGLRTTFGSPLYASHVPDEDEVAVQRLRAAGAIVVGKTNTAEFGYGATGHNPLFPTTRNPWNTRLTPGGSSAGSAAAVAAGMVAVALGSDGGGSVRIPAALTGTVGMKASFGRVPLYPGCRDPDEPGASGWESLEHIGPITRCVEDAALLLSVMAGPASRDRHSLPLEPLDWLALDNGVSGAASIAFTADMGHATVDPEVAAIAERAAQDLAQALGLNLREAHPGIGDTTQAFEALVAMDTDRAGLRRVARAHAYTFRGQLGQLLARDWTADQFTDAIMQRKRIVNALSLFMAAHDFLLTPTTAAAAFEIDSDGPAQIAGVPVAPSAWAPFSAFANLSGQPAVSVPAGFTRDGLPVGLQIVGRHQDDLGVLRLARAFERLRPWPHACMRAQEHNP